MQELLTTIDPTLAALAFLTASAAALRTVIRLVDSAHEAAHNMRKRKQ